MRLRPLPLPLALVFAGLGGYLTELAFPDTGWWAVALPGVALLFLAVLEQRAGSAFLAGTVWGLVFFLLHITWADVAVGSVPWIALSTAEALLTGLGCGAFAIAARTRALRRSPLLAAAVFAVVWTATEILRSAWPFGGFPWGRLAFSQANSPFGRLAWLGGPTLVSLAVALAGAVLGVCLVRLARVQLGRAGAAFIGVFALVAVGLAVPLASQAENGFLRVGAVQGNVADPGLGAFANRYEVLGNHVRGTYDLLEKVSPGDLDVVLWPENASDVDPREDARAYDVIDDAARAVGAPLLIGTQRWADGGRYNEAALWIAGKGITATYAKQHPAPFAEYVPMREFARKFSDAVDLVTTDMLPGKGPGVFSVPTPHHDRTVAFGDVICFEVAYDDVVRNAITAGGQMLVVQTNNATFGYTPESTQQLAMAQLRAIETGRATIQISTVGVSAVIEPNGVVKQRTGLFTADTMVSRMPLRTSLTPAVRVGLLPNIVVCTLALGALFIGATSTVAARRTTRQQERVNAH